MKQNDHTVEIVKTTVVEVNEGSHALPPHRGIFKEYKVADYFCPEEWSKDGVFISVEEGQPMWFDLRGNEECACMVSVQRLNPVTGEPVDLKEGLTKNPKQNYLRLPEQLWLDGYSKDGKVYQFMVTAAGKGLAVNEYVLPEHLQDSHAMAFAFFDPVNPKPKVALNTVIHKTHHYYSHQPIWYSSPSPMYYDSALPVGQNFLNASGSSGLQNTNSSKRFLRSKSVAPQVMDSLQVESFSACGDEAADEINFFCSDILEERTEVSQASMGMGGRIRQKIVTDDNTVDYYKPEPSAILTVYMALPEQFERIMKKGKRQDASRKDEHIYSGKVGEVSVPLITNKD